MSDHTPELWDQLSIDTPELVAIEFPVAGIGSRFLALLLDYILQGVAAGLVLLFLVLVSLGVPSSVKTGAAVAESPTVEKWIIAILILIPFLFHWGYFTLFEAFWNGQTPGKRTLKLRVIQQTGRPIGLFESMTRNLIRIVDSLPAMYLVGAISIFFSRRQQRLGDLVAGTLVVHCGKNETAPLSANSNRTITAAAFAGSAAAPVPKASAFPSDALARLTEADLQVIESFLSRRLDLPLDTRAVLAQKLAKRAIDKMLVERPASMSDETLLEDVALGLRQIISIG
jgi:uncharacterized RDD family membrane protein YckC